MSKIKELIILSVLNSLFFIGCSSTTPQIQSVDQPVKEIETLGKLIADASFTKYTDLKGRLFIPDYFIQFDFDIF